MSKDISEENGDLTIRPAAAGDMDELRAWRNHPDVRKNFFNSAQVSNEEHAAWFRKKMNDPDAVIYIASSGAEKAGSIRFEYNGGAWMASVMINPLFSGKGLGSRIISLGVEKLIAERLVEKPIVAEIKKENAASIKAFEKAGFEEDFRTFVFKKRRDK